MRKLLLATSCLALALSGAPALAQTADSPPPAPEGKLPDAVTPAAYRLDLTVDPAKPRFAGHVEIDARLNAPNRFIYLHGRNLGVTKAVAMVGGKSFEGSWKQVDPTGVVLLSFAQPLPAGPVTFAFDYDAAFQDGPAGMFHVHVGDDWYSWTQFESIDARAAYPSFDQPGYKQPFTVTLRTPAGLKAVTNTPETSVTQEAGMDVHHFQQTLPLPTYLLAMMVGPFATADGAIAPTPQREKPLPLRIVASKPNGDNLAFALENTKPIIQHLEAYFGQSFPYPKLDQIATPIMPGAMENAGADVYNDSIIVLTDHASTSQKRQFGMVVSHELAHQWFGDLVTPAWWDDIWLNESFANWMGYRIGNEWRPDLNIASGALGEGFDAMATDALIAGRPIHQPITKNSQIDAAFDTITYGKGGHVVAMIAAFMGDTKFRDGVRHYMATHRYGDGTSAEFFKAMADVAGDPRILPAMQSFTDQQGVPLLTFTGAGGSYTVTQSRYARLGSTPPATQWGVPMCLRRGDTRQCTLLDKPSATVSLAGNGALMPNAGGTGYYRFELPPTEWDKLIATSATLSGGEAQALADSLLASFQAGRASATQLGTLAKVMAANTDSYAQGSAFEGLAYLDAAGMLDAPAKAAYHALLARIDQPLLAKLGGFDPRLGAYANDAPETSQLRIQLVGAMANAVKDPALRKTLGDAASAYLGGDAKALDPAIYTSALRIHVVENGLDAAKALFDRALTSQDPVFRPAALRAIAGSGRADVADWVLNGITDKRLRISERMQMIAGVTITEETRDTGYAWMHSHLDMLMNGGAGIFFASRIAQVVGGFCSVEKADAIQADFGPKLAGKTGELELARTVERVRDCGLLKAKRGAEASAEIAKLK